MSDTTVTPVASTKKRVLKPVADAAPAQRAVVIDSDKSWRSVVMDGAARAITRFTYKLREGKTEPKYGVQAVIDYSQCSQDEIIALANRTVVIQLQDRLRKMGESGLNATVFATVNVKTDIIDASRQQSDENVRLIALLAKKKGITTEQAAKLLDNIEA